MYQLSTEEVLAYKDQLPAHHYIVLMLRANCVPQKAIAEQLQISVGTVKSRLSRGVRNLGKLKEANAARESHLQANVVAG